jgi:hypothetical protein
MKRKIIISSILLLFVVQTFANRFEQFDFEKIKAKKIAYLTNALNLTPAEAEKFWPVYNEFEQKRFAIMHERRELEKKLGEKIEDMADDKYIELSKILSSFPKREGELFAEYNEKFLKILPPRKVVEFYVADMNFRGFLLREYKRGEHEQKK